MIKTKEDVVLKITVGYVVQRFEDGLCVSQDFEASDTSQYETEAGVPIEDSYHEENLYFPYDMIQPD